MGGLRKFLRRIASVFRLTPTKKESIMEIDALIAKLKQHREKLEARIVYKEREIQQKQEERHVRERSPLQADLRHFQKRLDGINATLSDLERKKLNLVGENREQENDFDNLVFPDVPGHRVGEHPVGENFHPEDPVPLPRTGVLPELISSMSEVPIIIYFSSARNI
ncbi:hypothetical protein WR25_23079 [Diploscapter pachys]|uniref:Uncharacterized protein n=1 Tax=Diploscapter pachys TaxID=2018661 RepID=A0A2A2K5V1_9BILA|nr:hypothetical protein WR25_23079 [Diploscapter pachys]